MRHDLNPVASPCKRDANDEDHVLRSGLAASAMVSKISTCHGDNVVHLMQQCNLKER